jgi:predicted AAA+ superfamily ATPase
MKTVATGGYQPRVIDAEFDALISKLPALVFEGAKAVGKTATAERRAATTWRLDDADRRAVALAEPARVLEGARPVLIDEWQNVPNVWDLVRRSVDGGAPPGSYLLTGSAMPEKGGMHSGAGRIVTLRMRPLSLAERGLARPTVSLAALLKGGRSTIAGRCGCDLRGYVEEILASGFPGLRGLTGRPLRAQLDSYLDRIVDREFAELGHPIRSPETLKRWMRAYAAASSTTTSFEKIRDAATSDQHQPPSRNTTVPYREILERLWILDPVPAWIPSRSHLRRLSAPPKHQLADPALAGRLLGVDADALLAGRDVGPVIPRDGTLLGALFESLIVLSVRVYAQAAEATVSHVRTAGGEHEVDIIVERQDGRVVALEVKLASAIYDHDVRGLLWLRDQIGADLLDAAIITTGQEAYRRADGIAVIPAALLGA